MTSQASRVLEEPRLLAPCDRCAGDCGGGLFQLPWGPHTFCLRHPPHQTRLLRMLGRRISPAAKAVLRALHDFELKGPAAWISNEKLAIECGYHSKQTILTARLALRAEGLLSWCHRFVLDDNGRQTTNLHLIHWRRVLELALFGEHAPPLAPWEPFHPKKLAQLPPEAVRGSRLVAARGEPEVLFDGSGAPPDEVATKASAAPEAPAPSVASPAPAAPSQPSEVEASQAPVSHSAAEKPNETAAARDTFQPTESFVWSLWKPLFEKQYRARYARNGQLDSKAIHDLIATAREMIDEQAAVAGECATRRQLAEQYLTHVFRKFLASQGHLNTLRERRHPLYLLRADLSSLGTPWKLGPPAVRATGPEAARGLPPSDSAPGLGPATAAGVLGAVGVGHLEAPEGGAELRNLASVAPVAPQAGGGPEVPETEAPGGKGHEAPGGGADREGLEERVERALRRWRALLGQGAPEDAARDAERDEARRARLRERLRDGLRDEDLERVWQGALGDEWQRFARLMRLPEPAELLELLKPGRWQRFLASGREPAG